ncbi:MAG: hypothetical protein ACE5HJ_01190 [Thermoplasmata archaeon]
MVGLVCRKLSDRPGGTATRRELEEGKSLQEEVRIVDLSARGGIKVPLWLVRRAAEILVSNAEQLSTEELTSLAHILMREAGSRVFLGEER